MAYDDDYDDEPRTAEEMLEAVRSNLSDLDDRLRKSIEHADDASASIRMDITLARREQAELRVAISRLQARFDNQLTALALANIASGVGVAALVLGAARAFGN